jgi:hypothetical protein
LGDHHRDFGGHVELIDDSFTRGRYFIELDLDIAVNFSVTAYSEHFVGLAGHVDHRGQLDFLLHEVFITVAFSDAIAGLKFLEVNVSSHAARCESLVVVPPVNATHTVCMASALHDGSAISCPEIVQENILVDNKGKQVATIGKLDFSHALLLD